MDWFAPVEGTIALYYGRLGNGKTYAATADILDLLDAGEVVFANWNVAWQGHDQRTDRRTLFGKLLFGKKEFFHYPKENFNYFHPDEIDIPMLGKLVNAHVFIDEGQWIFNSHQREQDPDKRRLVLHNRHYCRSLNIITQRPINVFKDMRSQINVWYKCEKVLSFLGFILFRRTSFEDMKDDLPDEEIPTGRPKHYWASRRVFEAYSTHAMRAGDAIEKVPEFSVFDLSTWDMVKGLISPRFLRERKTVAAPTEQARSQRKVDGGKDFMSKYRRKIEVKSE